jgi:hypothetical protein
MPVTSSDNLANEIAQAVETYTKEVTKKVEKAKRQVAKKLKEDIATDSPEKTGDYKLGWAIKRTKDALIVHNKTDYQLTHLLEHGHAKKGGGRVHPRYHIAPNADVAIRDYLAKIERAIQS